MSAYHSPKRREPEAPRTMAGRLATRGGKKIICGVILIVAIAAMINANVSQIQIQNTPASSSTTRVSISSNGTAKLAYGGRLQTAVARQGASQCVSANKADVPTAQCQTFCNKKFAKVSRARFDPPAFSAPLPSAEALTQKLAVERPSAPVPLPTVALHLV